MVKMIVVRRLSGVLGVGAADVGTLPLFAFTLSLFNALSAAILFDFFFLSFSLFIDLLSLNRRTN